MITSCFIHHFRSIAYVENLSLGPITIVIGKNNVGKSNFLHALAAPFSTRCTPNDAANGMRYYASRVTLDTQDEYRCEFSQPYPWEKEKNCSKVHTCNGNVWTPTSEFLQVMEFKTPREDLMVLHRQYLADRVNALYNKAVLMGTAKLLFPVMTNDVFESHDAFAAASNKLSDNSCKMLALCFLLGREDNLPLLLECPDAGLDRYSRTLLAACVQSVAGVKKQIVLTTHSCEFISEFAPKDILVVEKEKNESKFYRLSEEKLAPWLKDYSLGELWEKNTLFDLYEVPAKEIPADK